MNDLFDSAADGVGGLSIQASGIELFEAVLVGQRRSLVRSGHVLFEGYDTLKVITFSAGVPAILGIVELFQDVEITFGSERILAKELTALEQASALNAGYRFADTVADQKAFIELLVRPALSKIGGKLLQRAAPAVSPRHARRGRKAWRRRTA